MTRRPSSGSSTWCPSRRRPDTRPGPPPCWPKPSGTCRSITWRVLRQHGIHLQRRRSHEVSTDPAFSAKAVVLCVDEKPSIQALERSQGLLAESDRDLVQYPHPPRPAGASFTSPRQRRDAMDAFIAAYNSTAQPFEWKKRHVFPTELHDTYAELCR